MLREVEDLQKKLVEKEQEMAESLEYFEVNWPCTYDCTSLIGCTCSSVKSDFLFIFFASKN